MMSLFVRLLIIVLPSLFLVFLWRFEHTSVVRLRKIKPVGRSPMLPSIPKHIYQTWCTKSLPQSVRHTQERMLAINPGYQHFLFLDHELDEFVRTNFSTKIFAVFSQLNIITAKTDFWRYLVLYRTGGIYLDMDSTVSKPLETLIRPQDEAVISAEGNVGVLVQWAMIFAAQHPLLKKTIDLVVDNVQNNRFPNDIHKMTGPTVFTKAFDMLYQEQYGTAFDHTQIHSRTNLELFTNKHQYRLFGKDYDGLFTFKYQGWQALYSSKMHWTEESQRKPLLRFQAPSRNYTAGSIRPLNASDWIVPLRKP